MSEVFSTEEEREAYALGVDAAKAAASWTTDGNMDTGVAAGILAKLQDGDPEAFDYLPRYPDLSGEWADDPTPHSLFYEVMGTEAGPNGSNRMDAISDAWEAGVGDTFESACEAELIKFVS